MRRLPRLLRLPRPSLSSLRARLALWYLLVLGVALALFGAGIFVEVRGSLLDGVDTTLHARAALVAGQTGGGARGLRYRGADLPNAEAEIALYLFDARGRLSHQIVGSADLPPQPGVLDPALRGEEAAATMGELRLSMVPVVDGAGRVVGVAQAAQSLDVVHAQIDRLLTLLLVATPALLLVATAGGVFLAGRALAPIDRITRTARAIGAGNLAGRLGLAPRADEVGRLAATFDQMLDRLERAFAQQRRFAADASHELRTPLTIIKGDLDVVRRRPRSPAEYEAAIDLVDEEVTRLGALMEDLLTLARADSGQAELTREFVYLDALVDDVVARFRRLAEAGGLALELHLARDVTMLGDAARLRQLALNLVSNAVKYTPAGGRVRVTLTDQDGWARLEVEDTGIGIAPADLPHIFDRFFRADEARARTEGGTGLGLAIARWTAEAHGGRLTVTSRPGEGSVFTVRLPLALDEAGEATSEGAPGDTVAPLSQRRSGQTEGGALRRVTEGEPQGRQPCHTKRSVAVIKTRMQRYVRTLIVPGRVTATKPAPVSAQPDGEMRQL